MKCWIVAVVFFCLTVAGSVQAESIPGCAELMLNRCQACHYLDRVCSQIGEKSKRRWAATLKRMVTRRGADLSKEEQEFLLDCLLAPAPDIKKECKK